jgi:hypothetical protein
MNCINRSTLRIPTTFFVAVIVFVCAVLCGTTAFLVIYLPVNSLAERTLTEFTEAVAAVTVEQVQRRFDVFRSQAELAQRILANTPAFTSLDADENENADVPVDDTLRWFARSLDKSSLILVLFRGVDDGLIAAPYNVFDPIHFPSVPGMIAISKLSQASWNSYIDNGYFFLDSFQPRNATAPFVRNTTNRFNIGMRPYAAVFQHTGLRLRWSSIYVGVQYQATKTSSIGLGASWGRSAIAGGGSSGEANVSARSTISFHGYTKDVVAFFKTLRIGKTGVAILIDVASRAFVGGNIDDDYIRFVSTVNATTGTESTTPTLVLLEELQDPRVKHVIAAAAEHGGPNASHNLLLTCVSKTHHDADGVASCHLMYDHRTGRMQRQESVHVSLMKDIVSVIHVSAVRDEYGLDMRLIVIIPADDFIGLMRDSVLQSLGAASATVGVLMIVVTVLTQLWLLRPLSDMARVLRKLVGENAMHGAQHRSPSGDKESQGMFENDTGEDHAVLSSTHSVGPRSTDALSLGNVSVSLKDDDGGDQRHTGNEMRCGQLFQRPRLMRADVQSIQTNGIRELTTIREGLLKLLSALEIVGLFLPSDTTPCYGDSLSATGGSDGTSHFSKTTVETAPLPHCENERGSKSVVSPLAPTVTISYPAFASNSIYKVIVTTVAANFVKLHDVRGLTEHSPSTFVALHTMYLRIVMDSCRAHGGTIDLFYGDRVWAHFNAEKRLPGHALKACRALLAIEDAVANASTLGTINPDVQGHEDEHRYRGSALHIRVKLGAATTEALCGVMGSSDVKRFMVVGPCVRQATFLSACAGVQRFPRRGCFDATKMASETPKPVEDIVMSVGGADPLPFSSLVADKTVELASMRIGAAHRGVSSTAMPIHKGVTGPARGSNKRIHRLASIVFRHVRVSALPQGSVSGQHVVVSTPLYLHRVLLEYPELIVGDDATAALKRLTAMNAVYEHLAAGDARNVLAGLMQSLPCLDDEWLLRQLQREAQVVL